MTAHEQYKERRKEIENEIKKLKENLKAMDVKEIKDNKNYGYSGNCGYILNHLKEMNSFFNN